MRQDFLNSEQYRIKELYIQGKEGPIDIQNLFDEINLYDSIFLPVLSGNIIITDTIRLSDKLRFDGTEVISIHLTKTKNEMTYKKNFRIYKQSDRSNINQTTERYLLHFVAEEYITSIQLKLTRKYDMQYHEASKKIMENFIKTKQSFEVEDSREVVPFVVPNLTPLDAITWCAKRSMSLRNNAPEFVFYSDNSGFKYVTLSKLMNQKPVLDSPIRFGAKNLKENDYARKELYIANGIEVPSQSDVVDRIRDGVYAGKYEGFDTITGFTGKTEKDYKKMYGKTEHANKNPLEVEMINANGARLYEASDAHKSVYFDYGYRAKSNYVKFWSPESIYNVDDYKGTVFFRKAIFSNLLSKKVKVSLPGNFLLTSGKIVELDIEPFSIKMSSEKTLKDRTLSGKYLIVATRHILGANRHTTFLEVTADSTIDKRKLSGSIQQDNLARKKT